MKRPIFIRQLIATAILLLLSASLPVDAAIRLPDIIGSGMVLQQQSDVLLWGWANPGARITVSPGWLRKPLTVRTGSDGRWELRVPTPAASTKPYTIRFTGDGSRLAIDDVLIGEVWFCSGQSNMEMPLHGYLNQPVEHAADAVVSAAHYPTIRVAMVEKAAAETAQDNVASPWITANPRDAYNFSAIGYFFARELSDMLHVPVGIIDCSYQGTKIETWMSVERLSGYADIDLAKEKADSIPDFWHRSNLMYNAMLHPLEGYTIRGFLWYQGCSNMGQAQYAERMRDFVGDLRHQWGDDSLPFLFVELAPYGYGNPEGDVAARFREAQQRAAEIIPHSAIVCTSDLVYPYEVVDIHPSRKQEVAQRLAWLAGDMAYGIAGLPVEYPRFDEMTVEGDCAKLTFTGAPWGLTPHDDMQGFEVAGSDGVFHPAKAYIPFRALHVVVERPDGVDRIESVRYNFKNFAVGSVHNLMGLPLVPFRTDK
ncbi:MAG: sialate O-acetylesterase [Paramuribaculum sp.]|nr:sialate O-acetylesterase [Paramuribaculum sp.]